MYLTKENTEAAAIFVNGPLWADIKRCLRERKPHGAEAVDLPHVAAAKGFQRDAWDKVISEVEKLPFEFATEAKDPFQRPAVMMTED